jgi:hypothetical protein
MSAQVNSIFGDFLTSFEREAKTLKSISNLRALGHDCPDDVVEMLKKVEEAVSSIESRMDSLEKVVDTENKCLDENVSELTSMATKQKAAIDILRGDMVTTYFSPQLHCILQNKLTISPAN